MTKQRTRHFVVAWVGGPTGRGFNDLREKLEKEKCEVIHITNSNPIPGDVEFIIVCAEYSLRIGTSAVDHAKARGIPWARVTALSWSTARLTLENNDFFKKRDAIEELRAKAPVAPISVPVLTSPTPPQQPSPEPPSPTERRFVLPANPEILACLPATAMEVAVVLGASDGTVRTRLRLLEAQGLVQVTGKRREAGVEAGKQSVVWARVEAKTAQQSATTQPLPARDPQRGEIPEPVLFFNRAEIRRIYEAT